MGLGASCCAEEDLTEGPKEPPEVVSSYTDPPHSEVEPRAEAAHELSASRVPSKWSRLQHMRHLEVDAEILRGIPLQASLRSLGELWRRSPVDLHEQARLGLYDLSVPVEEFDVFLSHTWMTPGRYKVLSLLFQAGWKHMLLGQSLGVTVAVVLSMQRWLPLPFDLPSDFEELAHLTCPFFPWCLLMAFAGSFLALMLVPYCPSLGGRDPLCFLDVVSIHQVDNELMERGIYGLGGFLRMSQELRVLWSAPYLSRLWCVFELAAYRMANPGGRIVVSPVFVETGVLLTILFTYFVALLFSMITVLQEVARFTVYVISLTPVMLLMHLLRRNNMSKHQLLSDLRHFDLEEAHCRNEFDREFIHRAIVEWYGSKSAFTEYVRGPLREGLLRSSKSTFPLRYLVMVVSVTFCTSIDPLVSSWLCGVDGQLILSEFVASSFGFHVCWFLAMLRILIYLCDRFAAPIYPGMLDYLQTFVIFAVFFVLYYAGQVASRAAYTTSLSLAVVWTCLAVLAAILALSFFAGKRPCSERGKERTTGPDGQGQAQDRAV